MTSALHRKDVWTYKAYRALPADGMRYEIIAGELFTTPSPSISHQSVCKHLQFELVLQLERTGKALVFAAPVDVIFSDTTVTEPDLVVTSQERKKIIDDRGIHGAPDIIVEILSPSTAAIDRGRKYELYAAEGVREYWVVDPKKHIVEVHTLERGKHKLRRRLRAGQALTSPLFKMHIDVGPLFAPL